MLRNLIAAIFARSSSWVFLLPATTVAALVLGVGLISAPKLFVSIVQVKLLPNADNSIPKTNPRDNDQLRMRTECEVVRSEEILGRLLNRTGWNVRYINRRLGTQHGAGIPGRIAQLRKCIEASPIRNTNVIEICVTSDDRDEATQISDALVESYREYQKDLAWSPLKVLVVDRSLAVNGLTEFNKSPGVGHDLLGAILLGVAAGMVALLTSFFWKPPDETDVLPTLFVLVFSVVLGSALKSSVNLAMATTVGVLLAFVVGSLADWMIFVRRNHPEHPNLVPVVFISVFLVVIAVGILEAVWSPDWCTSTARVMLRTVGASPGRSTPYDPQLIKNECGVVRSDAVLGQLIEDLDLNRRWGKKYADGYNLKTKESMAILKHRIRVDQIPGTSVIKLSIFGESAAEGVSIANSLGDAYRAYRIAHPDSTDGTTAIQVELLDHALSAPSVKLQRLATEYAYYGLLWAFGAGGVCGRVLTELRKRSSLSPQQDRSTGARPLFTRRY